MKSPMQLLPNWLLMATGALLISVSMSVPPLLIHHRTKNKPPEPPPPPAWATSKLRPAMLEIPAGRFQMGSPKDEKDRLEERETQHDVRITRPFVLAETEVTQAQYEAVMGTNPSGHQKCPDCPVEQVNWTDAIAYCNTLSDKEGLTRCYEGETWNRACIGYRLPTEAEWEYAARAGREGEMYQGTKEEKEACRFGNYRDATLKAKEREIDALRCDDGFEGISPVASFHANDFHLFDMGGNVYEWVWDWYRNDYQKEVPDDPIGPETGVYRVIRGGSWLSDPQSARVAYRGGGQPSFRDDDVGFRVARSLPSSLFPSHPLPGATNGPDMASRSPGGPGAR